MKKIDYTLIRSRRRTLCLEIRDGALIVRSPYLVTRWAIESFIRNKYDWINKKLIQSKRQGHRHKFNEVGKFLFLGKERDLGLPSQEKAKKFYLKQTARVVTQILKKYVHQFDFKHEKVRVKFYKSKWGSCTSHGHLSFNAVLVMAPIEVIEYVVIHELAHTKVRNHSKKFWQLVEQYDSGYKIKRKWLRDNKHNLSI